jgi:hypothetical protein
MVTVEDTELEGITAVESQEGPGKARAREASETPLEELGLQGDIESPLKRAGLITVQDLLDKLETNEKIEGIAGQRRKRIRARLIEEGFLLPEGGEAEAEQKRAAKEEIERDDAGDRPVPAASAEATAAEEKKKEAISAGRKTSAEPPILFTMKVWVDEQYKPQRTDLVRSGIRKSVPGLNLQGLIPFVEEYIKPPVAVESSVAPEALTISDVQIYRAGVRGGADFTLGPGEAFTVKVRFRLLDEKLISLAAQKPAYQLQLYTNEITSGTSKQCETESETKPRHLVPDQVEYEPKITVSGLSPGIHRLITVVTLQLPGTMLGHYDGPLIRVKEG